MKWFHQNAVDWKGDSVTFCVFWVINPSHQRWWVKYDVASTHVCVCVSVCLSVCMCVCVLKYIILFCMKWNITAQSNFISSYKLQSNLNSLQKWSWFWDSKLHVLAHSFRAQPITAPELAWKCFIESVVCNKFM